MRFGKGATRGRVRRDASSPRAAGGSAAARWVAGLAACIFKAQEVYYNKKVANLPAANPVPNPAHLAAQNIAKKRFNWACQALKLQGESLIPLIGPSVPLAYFSERLD